MIWTDRHGHEWDLNNCTPCRRCGQDKPGPFDTMCQGNHETAGKDRITPWPTTVAESAR